MTKIIIQIDDKQIGKAEAIGYVQSVIFGGYKSIGRGIPHYCWSTRFKDGRKKVWVIVRQKKTKKSPDSFIVLKSK